MTGMKINLLENSLYDKVEGEREGMGGSNPLPPPLLKKNSFLICRFMKEFLFLRRRDSYHFTLSINPRQSPAVILS